MSNDILVITEHFDGRVADISYEMVGKAKELAGALGGQAIAVMLGSGMAEQAGTFASDATIYVDDPALAQFNPEAYGRVLAALVEEKSPRLTMIGSTAVGMDVGAWLAAKTGQDFVAYVSDIALEDGELVATSNLFAGKMSAEVEAGDDGAVTAVLAGAFPVEAGQGSTAAEQIAPPVSLADLKTKFVRLNRPEGGDVDITAVDKLVAIGRGIGSEDNVELAEELAEAMGAVVAASRPVTDAGWLPKTRQVGKSGLTVKPKLYLMLGISGAPEHLEGMKDGELIIAINTDPDAPIFDVAHYGATSDLFDVAEAMLEELE
ncbi:MAG TPA: electron transfer flavoprotein subunit alpha/FixB family protein [Chloroflexi bacterium]|nr:electron transfer flavoprotein subunit alpha/FixB family protein [Chloroflexota bacterium]